MTPDRRGAALLLGLLLSCGVQSALAHDFWLQPAEFWTTPNVVTTMTLQVGHGPYRQRSPIPASRIIRFEAVVPGGAAVDLHERLKLGGANEDADFRLAIPGTHILVLQTDDRAQTHLPSIRFNDYLNVEGLTPALEQRARLHRMDADGSERYSRCAKSIVQVGRPDAGARDRVTQPVGLPLEIVPEASPYAVPRPATLPVHVIFAGHPLAGALVKLTDLKNDAAPFEMHVTDREGRAVFSMPGSGTWLLNVIWTRALPRSAETDFETVFSSLSFGFAVDRQKAGE
jgi:uncharacterized GH25 family protein